MREAEPERVGSERPSAETTPAVTEPAPVDERRRAAPRLADDVRRREQESVGGDRDGAPGAAPEAEAGHRRGEDTGHLGDDARVGVERLLFDRLLVADQPQIRAHAVTLPIHLPLASLGHETLRWPRHGR